MPGFHFRTFFSLSWAVETILFLSAAEANVGSSDAASSTGSWLVEGLKELISGAEEIERELTDTSKSEVGSVGPATVITIIVLGIVPMLESCFAATETNMGGTAMSISIGTVMPDVATAFSSCSVVEMVMGTGAISCVGACIGRLALQANKVNE